MMSIDHYREQLQGSLTDHVSGHMLGCFPTCGEAADLVLADMVEVLCWLCGREIELEVLRKRMLQDKTVFDALVVQGLANPVSVASVHAEILSKLKLLELFRFLDVEEYNSLAKHLSQREIQRYFDRPSVIHQLHGDPCWKVELPGQFLTLCYAHHDRPWISFDLTATGESDQGGGWQLSGIRQGASNKYARHN